MSEKLERSPEFNLPPTPEDAAIEAGILQQKIRTGDATTYAEAELFLGREKFQEKLAQKAKDRDTLRPKWKKWLGIGKTDPKAIEMERALKENRQIDSLVARGRFQTATEAVEYLRQIESSVSSSPKELDLEQRELLRTGDLLGGCIGGATFVELKDDGSAVYKPHDRYVGRSRIEYINKERAAYLIDRFLGFNLVPPTVVRELHKGVGSLQEFIPDAKIGYETHEADIAPEERLKLDLFDVLISNTDRNESNYLLKNKKIIAIDHGLSLWPADLRETYGLGRLNEINVIPPELLSGLRKFAEWSEGRELLADALTKLFDGGRATMILKRIELFIAAIDAQGNFSKDRFREGFSH